MKFECQKDCPSLCCKRPGFVYLSPKDITNIGKELNLNDEEVITNVAKVVRKNGKDHFVIEVTEEKQCPFLEEHGCLVWENKPEQCSGYVTRWPNLDIEKEAEFCPGIHKGKEIKETPITDNPFL